MAISRWPILTTLTLLLLSLVGSVEGQGKGYHSDHFDPKYFLPRENLITPITHPGLFTFDGRWTLRHESYQASTWQGTSFTVLLFGSKCNLQLRPVAQGKVDSYTFYIQVDGGPLRGMQIDGFDTSSPDHAIMQVAIDLALDTSSSPSSVLTPHTVRFVSIPETPLRFEGIWVENTQIKQGLTWLHAQDAIPSIEFIGSDIDLLSGRPLVPFPPTLFPTLPPRSSAHSLSNSAQFRAAESLSLRHSHITTATPLLPLTTQYFSLSPLNASLPAPSPTLANTDPNHPKNFQIPWHFRAALPGSVRTKLPDALVLDLGTLDVVVNKLSAETYTHQLTLFLARLLNQGYPDRRIIVLARTPGGIARENPILQANSATRAAQETLLAATTAAVKRLTLADPQAAKLITLHTFTPSSSNPVLDLEKALCRTVIPPPPSSYLPSFVTNDVLGMQGELSRAQRRCKELGSLRARVNFVEEYGAGDVLWAVALVGLAAGALWVARDTVRGAVGYVVNGGRGRGGGEGYSKLG